MLQAPEYENGLIPVVSLCMEYPFNVAADVAVGVESTVTPAMQVSNFPPTLVVDD